MNVILKTPTNDYAKIMGCNTTTKNLTPHIKKMKELFHKNRIYWQNSDKPFTYEIVD